MQVTQVAKGDWCKVVLLQGSVIHYGKQQTCRADSQRAAL
jgi:hypothetical protein